MIDKAALEESKKAALHLMACKQVSVKCEECRAAMEHLLQHPVHAAVIGAAAMLRRLLDGRLKGLFGSKRRNRKKGKLT